MKETLRLITVSLFFIGCEKEAFIDYNVENKSSSEIKVVFYNTDSYDQASYNRSDSLIIGVNEVKTIVVQSKGISKVSKYKETDTHLREFKFLYIFQNAVKSKADFSQSSMWEYSEQSKHAATYKCKVEQSHF